MKTKTEALANPEAGDRYKRKIGRGRTISKIDDASNAEWSIVYWNDNRNSTYWHVFKRWAAGAEYLGKDADNAKNPR